MSGGGKKGGGQPTVSTYYAGIHFVCCHGPIDKVTRIFVDERIAWQGASTGGNITINKPELFGGGTREGGVTGTVSLDFGGPAQTPNTYLVSKLGPIPAYRRVFSMILNGTYLGNNYYLKRWAVEAQRIHVEDNGVSRWYDATAELNSAYGLNFSSITWHLDTGVYYATINTYKGHGITTTTSITVSGATPSVYNKTFFPTEVTETTVVYTLASAPGSDASGTIHVGVTITGLMNAVHIVRECFTNSTWGYGYNSALFPDTEWQAAALTCYNEGLGFAFLHKGDEPIDQFIMKVLEHIQGNVYQDRRDGKYYITLVRKVTNPAGLLELNPSNITSVDNLDRKSLNDLVSIYTVKFYDNATGTSNNTTIQDLSLLSRQGIPVSKSKTYDGVIDLATAHKLAVRDSITLKTPVYSCTVKCNREAEDLYKGDAFVLNFPNYLDETKIMRIVSIDLGTSTKSAITINCIEDTFAAAEIKYSTFVQSKWFNPISAPRAASLVLINELPYYLGAIVEGDAWAQAVPTTDNYVAVAVGSPTSDSISAGIWTTTGTDFVRKGVVDFCFTGELLNGINKLTNTIQLTNVVDLDLLTTNHFIQVGSELMNVTAIDTNLNTLTVVRGVLDTVPENFNSGTVIFGWHDYSGSDQVTYFDSEIVKVKVTPQTPEGELPVASAPQTPITITGRFHMPYPPGNLQINAAYWPVSVTTALAVAGIPLTWATRNRIQQTAGLIGFYTTGITTEVGVTYSGELIRTDTSAVLVSFTGVSGSGTTLPTVSYVGEVQLRVRSDRSTFSSWQEVTHVFDII